LKRTVGLAIEKRKAARSGQHNRERGGFAEIGKERAAR
jgi:hypothetical protein